MRSPHLWSAVTCVLALTAVARAGGPPAHPASATDAGVETRTYNMTDLVHAPLRPVPVGLATDTTNVSGAGGGQSALHNAADADDVAGRTAQLLSLIQQSIDPGSWRNNGGAIGTLAAIDDVLVVTQTPAGQRAVADLLAGLRRAGDHDTTIRVDAAWLLLTPAEMGGGPDRRPPAITANNVYCQARTVGFNGQPQSANVQRTTSVVTALTPVVAPNVALFQPTMEPAQSGVALSVTPRLTAGGDAVLVDVDSAITATVARADPPLATTRPADGDLSAASMQAFANRPDRTQQQIRTTVRLRPGVPMIVGGMSDQPGTTGDHRSLCLVLTAYADEVASPTTRPAAQ